MKTSRYQLRVQTSLAVTFFLPRLTEIFVVSDDVISDWDLDEMKLDQSWISKDACVRVVATGSQV